MKKYTKENSGAAKMPLGTSEMRVQRKRARPQREQNAPDFLIRLTGKARARALSKDVMIHHRHD